MPEWFDPETLDAEQSRTYNELTNEVRSNGDFSSYAVANRGAGLAASGVDGHNLIYGTHRVAQYASVLGKRNFDRIVDVGCGLGITTDALAQRYPRAEVIGLEISQDAVEFAQRNFPGPKFIRTAIAPSVALPGTFDLILCQEFYPFTRTSRSETHRSYIDHFLQHLRPGGLLLIELSERERENSILSTIGDLGFETALRGLPFDRVYRHLPVFMPALIVSKVLSAILSRPTNTCILMRKN